VQPFRRTSAIRLFRRYASVAIWTVGRVLAGAPSTASPVRLEPAHNSHRVSSPPTHSLVAFIAEASQRFQVPVEWIRAVMHVESGDQVRAVLPKGAMGLMQIMPKTGLRARYRLGADPYNPHDNILAGAAYLREMHDRYGALGFLATYTMAVPRVYDQHLATGRPLPLERQACVATLMPMIDGNLRTTNAAPLSVSSRGCIQRYSRAAKPFRPNDKQMLFDALPNRRPTDVRIVDLSALTSRSDGLFVHLVEASRPQ
jgi:hypothetical protein